MESMMRRWCILRNSGHKRLTFCGTRRVITATRGFSSVSASPNAFCKYLKEPEHNNLRGLETTRGRKGLGPIFLGLESLKDHWAILRRATTFIAGQVRSSLMMSMRCNKNMKKACWYCAPVLLHLRFTEALASEICRWKGGRQVAVYFRIPSNCIYSVQHSLQPEFDTCNKFWTCHALRCFNYHQTDLHKKKSCPGV